MLRRIIQISAICFGVGLVGTAATLPFAVRNSIDAYNQLVSEGVSDQQELVLPQTVTQLRLTAGQDSSPYVELRQSTDGKVRVTLRGNGFSSFAAQQSVDGQQATVTFTEERDFSITRENLKKALLRELDYQPPIVVEVPQTVTITTTSGDQCGLYLDSRVTFQNSEEILRYGFQPTPEEKARLDAEIAQQHQQEMQEQLLQELEQQQQYIDYLENELESQYQFDSEWQVEETALRREIQGFREQFQQDDITLKQYQTMTDPLYQELRSLRQQQGEEQNSSPQVAQLIDSLCDKEKLLEDEELNRIANQKARDNGQITGEELAAMEERSREKRTEIRLSLQQDLRELEKYGVTGIAVEEMETGTEETVAQPRAGEEPEAQIPAVG